jgi:hypothetical protein
MQNLLSKTPYKFKKSYGGASEPQTPQDAPWLRGPSLKVPRYSDTVLIIRSISVTPAHVAQQLCNYCR